MLALLAARNRVRVSLLMPSRFLGPGTPSRHLADPHPLDPRPPRQPVGAPAILPPRFGPKTTTALSVAACDVWTAPVGGGNPVPYGPGSGYSHDDALALAQGCRRKRGSEPRGVLADPLPGRRGADRHRDGDGQPGEEPVLQHLGRPGRLSSGPDGAVHLAFRVSRGNRLALVVEPLAFGQANFELDAVSLPVQLQRHECQAFLLDRDAQADDLGAVEQQLALALRLVIAAVPALIGTDVHVDQECLSFPNAYVALT